jgi:hypothetical protein
MLISSQTLLKNILSHFLITIYMTTAVCQVEDCQMSPITTVSHVVLTVSPLQRHCFKLLSQQCLYLLQCSISFWHNPNIYCHNPLPKIFYFSPTTHSLIKYQTCYESNHMRVRVPVSSKTFSSQWCPDWLRAPSSYFPRGKVAREWSWLITSSLCQDQENVNLIFYSPIHLHGVVFN